MDAGGGNLSAEAAAACVHCTFLPTIYADQGIHLEDQVSIPLSELEQVRIANMKRNEERLKSLGLWKDSTEKEKDKKDSLEY
jgi:hypothetical protein